MGLGASQTQPVVRAEPYRLCDDCLSSLFPCLGREMRKRRERRHEAEERQKLLSQRSMIQTDRQTNVWSLLLTLTSIFQALLSLSLKDVFVLIFLLCLTCVHRRKQWCLGSPVRTFKDQKSNLEQCNHSKPLLRTHREFAASVVMGTSPGWTAGPLMVQTSAGSPLTLSGVHSELWLYRHHFWLRLRFKI